MADRYEAPLILRPNVELFDCGFDGARFVRRLNEADERGRRRGQTAGLPTCGFAYARLFARSYA